MSWNYRVVKGESKGEIYYNVREVYYEDDTDHIVGMTYGGTGIGNTVEELRSDLELMLRALDKPVLDDTTGGSK